MKKLTQTISLLISYTLIFLPLHAASIQTDGSTNTTLDKARNDVPVINIANPNASGLSHNKFREFNVEKKGLILNNSKDTTVNTQLGGFIFGNKNLTSNAKVILNEVTSTSRTNLNGYTEVAGKRADLIIANPNGLSVNGAGFINTSSVTLSTGIPIINRGNLESFNILGGDISIDGDGLDAMGSDSTYVYTHFLKLNADIHAKNLDIKLGKNSIDANTNQIISSTNSNEVALFLLDASTLGGMYTNRISLVGTDKGLGVNLPPEVLASTGEIYISNDGDINLQNLKAKTDISIDAKDSDIKIEDAIKSGGDINLKAKDVKNDALISSSKDLTITSDNLTNNRTIFSGNDTFLYTKDTLINNEDASILSVNNLTMSADNSNDKTNSIKNTSARVETLKGDINIYANDFINKASTAPIKDSYVESSGSIGTRYMPGSWRSHQRRSITIESLDKTDYIPSTLISGNDIYIDANTNNEYSLIAASGNMTFLGSLLNTANLVANKRVRTTGYVQHCDSNSFPKSGCSWYHKYNTDTTALTLLDNADSTIQAGGSITADVSTLVNSTVKENEAPTSSTTIDNTTGVISYKNNDTTTTKIVVPTDDYGDFVKTTDPDSKVLIETNPEYTLYENFISSDYMMSHMEYDSELTSKKLGDALYENTLVRESIFSQTGRRFLNNKIKNDNEQFKYLMDNAIQANKSLELSPGISLSKAQINALTQDIVWMEEQIVQGEKVLVPVVYIANVNNFRLEGARIIAGDNIKINASDSILNMSGDIIASKDIDMKATNDISNISANIKAKNINLTSTDANVINKRSAQEMTFYAEDSKAKTTLVGKEGQIVATNTLNINAEKDITIQGSKLQAKDINLDAKNVNITTTVDKKDFSGGDSDNYIKEKSTTHLASNINADNINITATDTTSIKGSNLNATNDINIKAKKIDVLAVNDSMYRESKKSSKGFMSSSTTLDIELKENVQSSKLNANNIVLASDNDLNLESVNINANDSVDVSSKNGNVNLLAKSYTNATFHEKTSSSFGGLVGSHSIDSISKTKLGNSSTKAINNIVIGGKNINILANDLSTDKGNIKLSAVENVNIISGTEKKEEQHLKESTSLSLGVSGSKLTYAKKTKDATVDETITNKSSNIKTKNLIIESGQDTNVIASNITADSMQVDAKRDFNVLSDKNIQREHKEHSTQELGFELTLNKREASLFAGYWEEANGETTVKSSVAQSNMEIGSLNVASKNTNIVGSNIYTNDMKIDSENINIIADRTNTNIDTFTKSIKAGVSVGVSQNISNAVDAIENQGRAKSNSAIVSRGLKTYDAITSAIKKPVEAGIIAIYEESRINTNSKNDEIVSSNLHANNSIILNAKEDIEVVGSNIASENELKLNAKNINIHSVKQNYSYDTSSSSINAKANIFGTNMGDVTIGAQTSDLNIEGTQEINSHVYAKGKATMTSKEDTTLKGATVEANELEVNVGRNLVMKSVQDTESTKGSSTGGSISGNVMSMTPTGISGNVGSTKGSKKWVNEVTSLNANEKIKVIVNEKTTLSGTSITNLDEEAKDKGDLKFSTKTLEVNNIKDHDTYASTTMGIGLGSNDSKPSLNSIEYTNNTKDKEQIVRTTVGEGTITTTSDISNLNRDTTKIKEITKDESSNLELYASDNSFNAIMNPVKAKEEIQQNIKDMGLNAHKEILENIPSGNNGASDTGNKVEDAINDVVNSTIGELLDAVSTAGVLPSQENGGGYITQIATQLFGDNRNVLIVKDKNKLIEAGIADNDIQKMTLVKTKKGIKKISEVEDATGLERVVVWTTNPDKAVRIDEQPIANDSLKDYKIHVSSNDIKNAGLDHIFTNGMFNNSDTAIYNQQTQQGYADGLLNYNQQHGILGDIIEDAQDHITSNTGMSFLGTGGSRQTGEAIKQMTVITKGNLAVGAHSQGTMMSQNGLAQNKEEIAKIVQNNPDSKFLVGYAGSPVNHKVAEGLVTDIYGGEAGIRLHIEKGKIDDVFRSHVSPQDTIGSFLGWQSAGINNSEQLGSNVWSSFISTPMLFGVGGDSSHSYYPCVIGCGDGKFIPKIENYYNPNNNQQIPLVDYYKALNVDTTLYIGEKK